ncbi:MAG: alkaline phosphatase family protein [Lachnospiraceae bacterium]|jgi:predicted AlkP superfamily pyrophosphatase or phosphodiesterase|nr:alkaline phosphatase family protein [Lachnospiraceae bacterium]MCI1727178.1 alkaline phosphatase family protein [Lachnospiraceae bacterium]
MSDTYNSIPIKRLCRTISDLLGVPAPEGAAPAIPYIENILKRELGGTAGKAVLYHADAIGSFMIQKYTEDFAPVFENSCTFLPMTSTVMSVTPVSHATMYTGLDPEQHGIRVYEKPRLTCETLYDTLLKAGRHPAIIAMPDSSFLHIFSGRDMPYIEVSDNAEALSEAEKLMKENVCDVISIHTFEYDDSAHETGPESRKSYEAAVREAQGYGKLCDMIRRYWSGENTLVGYMPDHGQHLMEPWEPNPDHYVGDHGSFRTEDMNITQFFGVVKA